MEKPTVLVVDDEAGIRNSLARVLDSHGYTVVGAANGREALEYLRRAPRPSVILLDMTMPVMGGRTFLVDLRADPALASIPVIVIHSTPDPDLPDGVERIEKPFDMEQLLAAIARHCR